MDERSSLSEVEHEIDLRAAAVVSFIKGLRAQHGRHLEELDTLEWIVTHHSPATADLLASYRRILVRFLDDFAAALHARLGADIESGVIAALHDGYGHQAVRPTSARVLATELASRAGHPVVGTAAAALAGGDTESSPLLSALAVEELFGSSPALQRSEGLFDELLAQWTRHERDEARALVDDAHARAAVAHYLTPSPETGETVEDAEVSAAVDRLGDDPVLDLSGHSLASLLELFGGAAPSGATSCDEWWNDAPEHDDTADDTMPAPAAADPAPVVGSTEADVADSTPGDLITLSEEQLDIAFADFWTGDLARQATARFTEAISQQQRPERRTIRMPRLSLPRRTDAGRRSNLVAGIVPVVGLTAMITLLMALVG